MQQESFTATQRRVHGVSLTEVAPAPAQPERTPIVFVHGGCFGAWQFEESQQEFAALGRRSVALDWLNHGQSDRTSVEEWLVRGIDAVVEEISVAVSQTPGKPVLFGHSMGGMAVTLYACQHPETISALVLGAPVIAAKYAGPPMTDPIDFSSPWGPPPPEVATAMFYETVSPERAAQLYPKLQAESPTCVRQATRWDELDPPIDQLEIPVMVLTGETDQLTPSSYIVGMAESIGAEHVQMDGAGHGLIFDERWPSFCTLIDAWIGKSLREE